MARQHVDHSDIVRFAQDKVNLPKDKASEYRAQARRLRERLDSYLSEHPDFTLRKILLSGSLAKGTTLRFLNDIAIQNDLRALVIVFILGISSILFPFFRSLF